MHQKIPGNTAKNATPAINTFQSILSNLSFHSIASHIISLFFVQVKLDKKLQNHLLINIIYTNLQSHNNNKSKA